MRTDRPYTLFWPFQKPISFLKASTSNTEGRSGHVTSSVRKEVSLRACLAEGIEDDGAYRQAVHALLSLPEADVVLEGQQVGHGMQQGICP